ncbi:MAG: 6 protein, partial [Thermoproteota archaeon]|nr:6 protein [Thermoproteota archaeon]
RISVDIPDELEKELRFKTIERFGGKKGDLSRAVEEAVKVWAGKKGRLVENSSTKRQYVLKQEGNNK